MGHFDSCQAPTIRVRKSMLFSRNRTASLPKILTPGTRPMSDQSDQVTLSLSAGDAVIMDYRLLHGTHGNKSDLRRDCIILNFAPSWHQLPEDIKGHLIIHTALPSGSEAVPVSSVIWKFLPAFHGERGSLRVNRNAPEV